MITNEDMKVLLKSQQGEMDALLMYRELAKVVKDEKDKEVFLQLASEEGRHAQVFKKYTNRVLKPKSTKAIFVPLMYRIIGKKKLYPTIAKGEYDAEKKYESVVKKFSEVQSVKADERRHGDMVLALLD